MMRVSRRWQQLRVYLEIGVWRFGWLWLLIVAAGLMASLTQWWWLPQQQKAGAAELQTLTVLQLEQASKLKLPAQDLQLDDDNSVLTELGRISYAEAEVTTVLRRIGQIASSSGLSLAQSEYQTSDEGHGGLRQVQVTLPMRATYPQMRQWIESILRQLPGVSIDQIMLKREAVSQSQGDIRIKLSIWVDPYKASPSIEPQARATKMKDGRH